MTESLIPAAFALFLWWFGTGVVLWLNHLPRARFGSVMALACVVGVLAIYGIFTSRVDATPLGAGTAFACAVVLWGVLELSYYFGFVTGVHRRSRPATCSGGRRFLLALGTSIYHELAVVIVAGVVTALTWQADNQVALWSYLVLWLMRWSAKLNLFLGVPNFHDDWLPDHLQHVTSYVSRRSMNLLFPISITAATAVAAALVVSSQAPAASAFETSAGVLVATLLVLAILEHWFLVLPLADGVLWRWAQRRNPHPGSVSGPYPATQHSALLDATSGGIKPDCSKP